MEKYIGFDIAYKKTVACVVQKGKLDKYETLLKESTRAIQRAARPRNFHLNFAQY